MAKVRHPLLSIDATGKLSDSLHFAHSPTGNIARGKRQPATRTTQARELNRRTFAAAAAAWTATPPELRIPWHDAANHTKSSPQNLYISAAIHNLDPTGQNLRHWFPCNDPPGTVILDRMTNISIDTQSTPWLHPLPHTIQPPTPDWYALINGDWATYHTNQHYLAWAAFVVPGDPLTAPDIAIGDINGAHGTATGRGIGITAQAPFHTASGVAKALGDTSTTGHAVLRPIDPTDPGLPPAANLTRPLLAISAYGGTPANTYCAVYDIATGQPLHKTTTFDAATYPKFLPPWPAITAPPSDVPNGFTPLPWLRLENVALFGLALAYYDHLPPAHLQLCRLAALQWTNGIERMPLQLT